MLANVSGNVRLGALLVIGTVDGIFTAIVLVVVAALLRAMVRVALLSAAARRLGIAPDHSDTVRRACFRTIALAITILWIVFTLKGFMLYEPAVARIGRILEADVSIGAFSLSLGKVLTFVFIIWLSIKLAALVDFVLEVVVLQHFRLPVGVPQTISRISRYIVILVGVVVAFSAIGFDLGKTALVAGGLGVGIGFGLQNIVNNFVSGLILLFERPIRVGDTVEVGSTSGVVEKIGMRATLIRTWRGPELVVPNAHLVSSDVLNWNLKRDRRRIEIPVGVDYESDPETVAKLLIDTAADHPEVLDHPKAECPVQGLRRQLARLRAPRLGERGELRCASRASCASPSAAPSKRRGSRSPSRSGMCTSPLPLRKQLRAPPARTARKNRKPNLPRATTDVCSDVVVRASRPHFFDVGGIVQARRLHHNGPRFPTCLRWVKNPKCELRRCDESASICGICGL